jgi:hypothetical protein
MQRHDSRWSPHGHLVMTVGYGLCMPWGASRRYLEASGNQSHMAA